MEPTLRAVQVPWYLVYAKPRAERVAEENLARQGYTTYLPRMCVQRRRSGQLATFVQPLFPRYLFVQLNAVVDNLAPIRSTVGVSGLVRFGMDPARVPEYLVSMLQSQDDADGIHRVLSPEFHEGDTVRVAQGALEGCEGIFLARTNRERVWVLLKIAGRYTQVGLPPDHLEGAEAQPDTGRSLRYRQNP